jgi:hypothetical protein
MTAATRVATHTSKRFSACKYWANGGVKKPPTAPPRMAPAAYKGNNRFACRVSWTLPASAHVKVPRAVHITIIPSHNDG